jgi:type VI protein secretion system component Hcp
MSKVASLFLELSIGTKGPGASLILGEAKDAVYRDQIEINSWSWDLSRSSESAELTKIGSSIPPPPNSVVPSALKFSKTMCRATSGMLGAMRQGKLLTAVFSLEEDSDVDFKLEVTLGRVRILEYEFGIDGMEVTESWKLNYETIRFDYSSSIGGQTATLTRHAGASTKDPSAPAAGGDDEKIMKLAEGMDAKQLKPLIQRLEQLQSAPSKLALKGPVPGKLDKVTKGPK